MTFLYRKRMKLFQINTLNCERSVQKGNLISVPVVVVLRNVKSAINFICPPGKAAAKAGLE